MRLPRIQSSRQSKAQFRQLVGNSYTLKERPEMATATLATVPERVSVLETKVDNIEEKIDDLKINIKDMHDCLDKTRDDIMDQLAVMHQANVDQHSDMAGKIKDLEQFKTKWVYLSAGAIAALGWVTAHSETLIGLLK